MAASAAPASTVGSVYRALARRNRMIGILRFAVPLFGLTVLGALVMQMLVASFSRDFTIGRISIDRERMSVQTPTYRGLLADGSTYEVTAQSAETLLEQPTIIVLTDAHLVVNRVGGVQIIADAATAELETELQQVTVDGVTLISDSTGMNADVVDLRVDALAQTATGAETRIVYPGGETLEARAMRYDPRTMQWQFARSTVTVPDLPDPVDPEPAVTEVEN